jgi:hypothetical protein
MGIRKSFYAKSVSLRLLLAEREHLNLLKRIFVANSFEANRSSLLNFELGLFGPCSAALDPLINHWQDHYLDRTRY